jgi:hypothetical protein
LFSYAGPGFSKSKKHANAIMPASALPKGQRTKYDGKYTKIKIKMRLTAGAPPNPKAQNNNINSAGSG